MSSFSFHVLYCRAKLAANKRWQEDERQRASAKFEASLALAERKLKRAAARPGSRQDASRHRRREGKPVRFGLSRKELDRKNRWKQDAVPTVIGLAEIQGRKTPGPQRYDRDRAAAFYRERTGAIFIPCAVEKTAVERHAEMLAKYPGPGPPARRGHLFFVKMKVLCGLVAHVSQERPSSKDSN